MGRPQKHTTHPLYKLRQQLEVTQSKLAEMVNVPRGTLQSNECGRRGKKKGLKPAIKAQIERTIWAVWDEEQDCWLFKHSMPPERITYELWQKYARFICGFAPLEVDREAVKMRVDALFDRVPKYRCMWLFWRLQDCLEECRRDLGIKVDEALFEAAKDEIHFSPGIIRYVNQDGSYNREKEYVSKPLERFYRPGRAYWRGKKPDIEKELKDYLRDYYKQCAKHYADLSDQGLPTRSGVFRLDLVVHSTRSRNSAGQ